MDSFSKFYSNGSKQYLLSDVLGVGLGQCPENSLPCCNKAPELTQLACR